MPIGFTTKSLDFKSLGPSVGFNPSGLVQKAALVNLDTNEKYKFVFNPTEITRVVRPVYAERRVQFRSANKWSYKYTEAAEWRFTLYLHSTSSGAQGLINILPLSKNLNEDTAFLDSLCYPIKADGLEKRRTPRVRFVWPKLANVRVIVTEVSSAYSKFNFRLEQQMTMVDIVLREDPEFNQTSDQIRAAGNTGLPGLLGAVLNQIPGASSAVKAVSSLF